MTGSDMMGKRGDFTDKYRANVYLLKSTLKEMEMPSIWIEVKNKKGQYELTDVTIEKFIDNNDRIHTSIILKCD